MSFKSKQYSHISKRPLDLAHFLSWVEWLHIRLQTEHAIEVDRGRDKGGTCLTGSYLGGWKQPLLLKEADAISLHTSHCCLLLLSYCGYLTVINTSDCFLGMIVRVWRYSIWGYEGNHYSWKRQTLSDTCIMS